MSKKIFKKQEIDKLSKNKYIKSISSKSITYTDEFREYFIIEYLEHHKLPLEIFENVGLDTDIIGHRRIESAANRWKTKYLKDGILSLKDTRSINSGRTKANPTIEDIISKKDAEIAYWKAEAELIKKLDTREISVKNGIIAPNKVYFLIDEIIEKYNFKNMVKHLCEIAGVSRSGYYKHHKVTSKKELREQHDLKLKQLVLKAKKLKGFDKGSRTITMIINNEFNVKINRKTVQRIMRKYGIKCKIRKTNPYKKMVKATKEHRVLPNVLNREFKQEIPGKVLLTDITYIKYKGSNIAYLSTIKDGSTNEILAYKLSKNLKLDFVLCTVKNLVKAHKGILTKESTIHSDQGGEFQKNKELCTSKITLGIRTKIFYCHPSSPYEKPNIENVHILLRKVFPKNTSLKEVTTEDVQEVVSNINSLKKTSLNGKTPNELFIKAFGKNLLNKLSLRVYESEDVILKKY